MMSSLLYTLAALFFLAWIIGFFWAAAGGVIHILLVLAVVSFIVGLVRRSTVI